MRAIERETKPGRTACEISPDDTGARQELAASLVDVGEYAEAIRLLKEIARAEPNNVDALIDLGIAYSAQGFYSQEARPTLRRATETSPEELAATYHLATLLRYLGTSRRGHRAAHARLALDRASESGSKPTPRVRSSSRPSRPFRP